MRYIKMIIFIIFSTIKLLIKKLFGCKVKFGMVNLISPFAHVYTEKGGRISIGNKTGIRPGAEIKANGGNIRIGNGCFVNRGSMVVAHESIEIEDGVTIGPGTYIYDHDHNGKGGYDTKPVKIEKNAWIGANCVVLKGVTIGEGAVIAAGGVVSKDVPSHVTMYQKRETVIKK